MKKNFNRFFAFFLCIVLIAATALFANGCSENKSQETPKVSDSESIEAADDTLAESLNETDESGACILGEGEKEFSLTVVDKSGAEEAFIIRTDKKTVGDALMELGLVEGEEGDYGLYVKKVNGIEADYDKDQTYWAFYINGEYAMSGVDTTDIEAGAEYCLKVEG